MGAVYAAVHLRNGKHVAVKLLHEASDNAEILTRFQREGYVANVLDDPGVVDVFDDGVAEDGTAYLVMELLRGESIEDRAQRRGGRLPWGEVLSVAYPVLGVLEKAHSHGIVHRDLKPSNLFLTLDRQIKVLDFGLAGMANALNLRVTGPDTPTMGTLGFMPPEQVRGEWDRVGPKSDIWAMGATLFALLTGLCVHENGPPAGFMKRALMDPAPPLLSLVRDVPIEVAAIVDRALAFAPEDRFADAAEMRAAVQSAYDVLSSEPLEPLIPSEDQTPLLDFYAHRLGPTVRSDAHAPTTLEGSQPVQGRSPRAVTTGPPVAQGTLRSEETPSLSTAFRGGIGLSAPPLTLPPSVRPSRRILIATTSAGLALLALAAWFMIRRSETVDDSSAGRLSSAPSGESAPSGASGPSSAVQPTVTPRPSASESASSSSASRSVAPDEGSSSPTKSLAPVPPPHVKVSASAASQPSAAPIPSVTAAPAPSGPDLDRRH